MGNSDNRLRILFMERIFLRYTDEEHALTIKDIGAILKSNGFNDNKNTIRDDIAALQQAGLDIIHEEGKGYKLVSRLFEFSDIIALSDAVASFKFITVAMSNSLIEKLKKLCSNHQAKYLHRQFHIAHRVKTDNKQVLINIDAITTAMRENKQFTFDYYDYDTENNMVYNGTRQCSPWEMAISSEEYYAVSYYLKYPTHPTNFRIDRMKNIQLLNESRVKPPKEIVIGDYLKSSFSMFSGMDEYVTLRFPMRYKMCNVVYDKFGHDTHITKDGDKYFQICVPIKTEQPKAFFSWLALFEGEVQILKPLSLAEEFLKRMKHLVETINDTIDEIEKNHRISSENNSVDTR